MGNHSTNQKQARVSDYLVYAIYRIIESVLRLLPMEVVCAIGSALGQLGYFLMGKRRQIVIRNLRIAFGEQFDQKEIRALARKTFRNSGLNLIASISAATLSNKELLDRVEIEGIENLKAVYAEGHGCILMLAHMGNWELLTQLSILVPEIKSLASIYRPLNNPLIDRLVKRRRQRHGTQLFSRRDSFVKPISHLKSGGTLGAIADQHTGVHGVAVPLFGKLTSMTNLPALLHRKTKAPILPISMCTLSLGKWKVVFHPMVEVSEENRKNTHGLTMQCAKAYERIMSESPADVLWMHGYWRVGRRFPLRIDGTQKKVTIDSTFVLPTPYRVLVYLGDIPASDQEVVEQLDRLKNYRPDIHLTTVGEHSVYPDADRSVRFDRKEPPHILACTLRRLNLTEPTPFDSAIDFTDDCSGTHVLKSAGLPLVFARHGKHQSKNTKRLTADMGKLTLAQFLDSLGIQIPQR